MKTAQLDKQHECNAMRNADSISIERHDGKWYWIFWDDKKGNSAHGIAYCPYCGEKLND